MLCDVSALHIDMIVLDKKDGSSVGVGKVTLQGMDVGMKVNSSVVKVKVALWLNGAWPFLPQRE